MAIFELFIAAILFQERAPLYGTLVFNLWKSCEICLTLSGGAMTECLNAERQVVSRLMETQGKFEITGE
jgi:hypothetical protein